MMKRQIKQATSTSNSIFQGINTWDYANTLLKFLPSGTKILTTRDTSIVLIVEDNPASSSVSMLDRIVDLSDIAKEKNIKVFGKNAEVTQDDALKMSNILNDQSKRLAILSEAYRLIAVALSINKDDFAAVIKKDKDNDNPFE